MQDSVHPLRRYRRSKTPHIPLRELAAKGGISKVSLSRIETGKQALSPELGKKFSDLTGIPIRKLCPELAAMFERAEPTE